jgi:hypothetical protein
MPTFTPTSGFTGTAYINGAATSGGGIGSGTELPVVGWDVNPSATVLRYMNSLTGNHPAKATTFSDCDFSIEIDWDATNQPFSTAAPALAINVTTVLTNVHLTHKTGQDWFFPSAIVIGAPQTLRREGKIVTRLQCTSNGAWTAPGGTSF